MCEEKTDGVALATMHHSSDWNIRLCFLLWMLTTARPHHKAISDADIEEERRMFYVAMDPCQVQTAYLLP